MKLRKPQYTIHVDDTPVYSIFYENVKNLSEEQLLLAIATKFHQLYPDKVFYFDMKLRCQNIPIRHSEAFESMFSEVGYDDNIHMNIKTYYMDI